MHWWTRACCGHMHKTTESELRKHVLYLHQLLLETFSVYRKYPNTNSVSVTFDIACQPATHTHTHTHTATPPEFHIVTHIETCIICCWNTILFPDLTPQLLDHLLNAVLFLKVSSGGSYQVSLEIPIFSSFSPPAGAWFLCIMCIPSYTHSYWPL